MVDPDREIALAIVAFFGTVAAWLTIKYLSVMQTPDWVFRMLELHR